MQSFQHIVTQGSRSVKVVSPADTVASSVAPSTGAASIDIEEFTKPSQVFTKERKASELAKEVQEVLEEKKAADSAGTGKEVRSAADIVTTETPRTRRTSGRAAAKAAATETSEEPLPVEDIEPATAVEDTPRTKKDQAVEKEATETPVVAEGPPSPVPGPSGGSAKTTASDRFEEMLRWLDRNNAGKLEQSEIAAVEVKPGKFELQAHGMPVVFKEIKVI